MNNTSVYHQGELQIQTLANVADTAQRNGRVISDAIPAGAVKFVGQQQMVAITSLDPQGNVWISVLFGDKGFIGAPDARRLAIDTRKIISSPADPFWQNIKNNPQIGVIALELSTRRRLRVNGRIRAVDETRFEVTVEQAYPNCPKYIQRRDLRFAESPEQMQLAKQAIPEPLSGVNLSSEQVNMIEEADSLFVGSATGQSCDASYRGGNPGFIEVVDGVLSIPDYQGNSMFNTLGNIQLYPKASIVIIDFERGSVLQLTGSASILWDQQDERDKTGGTKRIWQLKVEHWQRTQLPQGIQWQFQDYSPHNPRATQAKSLDLQVLQVKHKSERIKRFRLVSANGGILPAFEPGAHLPVEVTLPDGKKSERYYSLLSSGHDNRYYDIAVQHEPLGRGGSAYIHNNLHTNSIVKAKPPRNEFTLAQTAKHTILIAGGIGITPILSMLRHLVESQSSFEIHYTARTKADLVFSQEVQLLAGENAYLYHTSGEGSKRLDLRSLMFKRSEDTHIYMCGPTRLIGEVRELGEEFGWHRSSIHFESFGVAPTLSDSEIVVTLKKSQQVIQVKPTQTILDALIDAKVSVPYDCKRGECGMCVTNIVEGEAEHRDVYLDTDERAQSLCVCVSRAKGTSLTLDL